MHHNTKASLRGAMQFAAAVPLPNYEAQVAALLVRHIKAHLRKQLNVRQRRVYIHPGDLRKLGAVMGELTPLAGTCPSSLDLMKLSSYHAARNAVQEFIEQQVNAALSHHVAVNTVRSLLPQADIHDMNCRMPPPKRAVRAKRKSSLTAVERRARTTEDRLKNWTRKQALAKTKIAALRKKVTYYKKKGALQ